MLVRSRMRALRVDVLARAAIGARSYAASTPKPRSSDAAEQLSPISEGSGPLFGQATTTTREEATSPSPIAPATNHSSQSIGTDPLTQLRRCDELRRRTGATNRASEKIAIIAEYPDLRELLEFIYQPKLRFGLRPAALHSYLQSRPAGEVSDASIPRTLLELFQSHTPGVSPREAYARFLQEHGIWTGDEGLESKGAAGDGAETPYQTFGRLLLRNLNSGWQANRLKEVQWGGSSAATETEALNDSRRSASTSQNRSQGLDKFQVALGRPIQPPFTKLFKSSDTAWYASRKLDGLRCITFIDIRIAKGKKLEIENVRFLSRAGNEFTSLNKLRTQLERIVSLPHLRKWLDKDPEVVEDDNADHRPGVVKRLVLDGEICVLRKSGDVFVEDFLATVSQVRTQKVDVEHPAYFLLDVLSWSDFSAGSAETLDRKPTTFMQRHHRAKELSKLFSEQEGAGLRLVPQVRVDTLKAVENMVGEAAANGWEGLVFRADAPYKGNRSSDVYKFKVWQDAEYTVQSVSTSVQRLPINGVYGEHEACSSVWIEHRRNPVSVGAGFTVAQRLKYAKDPSAIIGKQITVEYFAESASTASGREGVSSLRFPRVKHVWEEGKRSV